MNWEINGSRHDYGFVNRSIVFILLKDKLFLLAIPLVLKYLKK